MNGGMKLLLLDRSNVPENLREDYDLRIKECQYSGLGADVDGKWKKRLKEVFEHDDFYPF